MNEFKPGDYIISLIEIESCRKIGTVHKFIEYVTENDIKYVDLEKSHIRNSFRLATPLEIVTAKLLGKCYG